MSDLNRPKNLRTPNNNQASSVRTGYITVSIVSHGHGSMVQQLVEHLLNFTEVKQILLTFNLPEDLNIPTDHRIELVYNKTPKGFASNHNSAFELSTQEFFCPLNPDVKLIHNPFPSLLDAIHGFDVGMVAPLVETTNGVQEDSWRKFPTFSTIALKLLGGNDGRYTAPLDNHNFNIDWAAGMFMLFPCDVFRQLGGFDEEFFLYYEDVDISARLWKHGYRLLACPSAVVVHDARRDSRRKLSHLRWHLISMIRYLFKRYAGFYSRYQRDYDY